MHTYLSGFCCATCVNVLMAKAIDAVSPDSRSRKRNPFFDGRNGKITLHSSIHIDREEFVVGVLVWGALFLSLFFVFHFCFCLFCYLLQSYFALGRISYKNILWLP